MLDFFKEYGQLVNFAVLFGIIAYLIRGFQAQVSAQKEQTNLYKGLLEQARLQAPLVESEHLSRRVEILKSELGDQRAEIENLTFKLDDTKALSDFVIAKFKEDLPDIIEQSTNAAIRDNIEQVIKRDIEPRFENLKTQILLDEDRRRKVYGLLVDRLGVEQVQEILGDAITLYLRVDDGDLLS